MNTQETRHYIEYEMIPEYVFSDRGADFINTLLIKHEQFFVDIYKACNSENPKYVCPYSDSDFKIDAMLIENDTAGVLRVKMPPALTDGDIVRMYFCHDVSFKNIRLYTISIDGGMNTRFMTWVDDSHFKDHGIFSLTEADENRTVVDFYMNYLIEVKNANKD